MSPYSVMNSRSTASSPSTDGGGSLHDATAGAATQELLLAEAEVLVRWPALSKCGLRAARLHSCSGMLAL